MSSPIMMLWLTLRATTSSPAPSLPGRRCGPTFGVCVASQSSTACGITLLPAMETDLRGKAPRGASSAAGGRLTCETTPLAGEDRGSELDDGAPSDHPPRSAGHRHTIGADPTRQPVPVANDTPAEQAPASGAERRSTREAAGEPCDFRAPRALMYSTHQSELGGRSR